MIRLFRVFTILYHLVIIRGFWCLISNFIYMIMRQFMIIVLLHPRMTVDLFNWKSVIRILSDHFLEKVSEFRGHFGSSSHFPVVFEVTLQHKSIMKICLEGLPKWEFSISHHKKDNSQRKYVGFSPVISLVIDNFWRCVCESPSHSSQSINIFITGKAEICNLNIHVPI